ncbi:MAG: AAA family ATPase [Pelagimonas sp.]|uniref:AAA family ATPase n=1 Tax=Pelagimonas sp. TaxID=2073170 RepID=UPI003D6C292B
MPRRTKPTSLPAPFLKRLTLKEALPQAPSYPLDLPFLHDDFEINFEQPVTIIIGENGSGKSTLVEAIAGLAGFDQAGGGQGYRPVDHAQAIDVSGSGLGDHLRAGWLPKVTRGWFFKAETFFSVARYLDRAAVETYKPPPDFLSWSHGEGFVRFFEERMSEQGIYFLDEPESALSPRRQIELLRLLSDIQRSARAQVIMATHSPILMAVPQADLWRLTHRGLAPTNLFDTDHFRLYRAFTEDPDGFIKSAMMGDWDGLT